MEEARGVTFLLAEERRDARINVLSLLSTLLATRMHSQLESNFADILDPSRGWFLTGGLGVKVESGPGPAARQPGIVTFVQNAQNGTFVTFYHLCALSAAFCHYSGLPRRFIGPSD